MHSIGGLFVFMFDKDKLPVLDSWNTRLLSELAHCVISFDDLRYEEALEHVLNKKMREMKELKESAGNETVDLEYDDLTITICGPKRDVDDWDEVEHTGSYTLTLDKDEVATTIWENFITEEDVTDVPGGLEALDDDDAWAKFLETHFDALFEKYYDALLKHYEDDATEAYEENYGWYEYQSDLEDERADYEYEASRDRYYESTDKNSMLEELEDADAYNKRLQGCPECGKTSFDVDTAICINCGLDLN